MEMGFLWIIFTNGAIGLLSAEFSIVIILRCNCICDVTKTFILMLIRFILMGIFPLILNLIFFYVSLIWL